MDHSYFQCSEPVPLTDGHFKDIAFNGVQFLLLNTVNSEISKYDCNFCFIERIALKEKYTSICYDEDEKCYWALSNNNAINIFRLDESLKVIRQIRMRNAPHSSAKNICYDRCGKTLWVSFPNRIAYTDKDCVEFTFQKYDCECKSIRNVLLLPEYRLTALSDGKKDSIHITYSNCEENIVMNIPEEYRFDGMCAQNNLEDSGCEKDCICILLTQICSGNSYVMCCTIRCRRECKCHICSCSCQDEICQIIHSIALAEVGIAHILNAEGEKIQKAVAQSRNTKELLEVNESVRCTITRITQLENQLTLKLEAAMRHASCDKSCCDKHCCNKPCCPK